MASQIYNEFKKKIGSINWDDNSTTDIRIMLVTSSYSLDIDTHLDVSDITNEVSGTGYTTGGELLTSRVIIVDTDNDWAEFDADDVLWANSTITARGAILYVDTGTPSTSTLIAYIDFEIDKSSSSDDFAIQWSLDGLFRLG